MNLGKSDPTGDLGVLPDCGPGWPLRPPPTLPRLGPTTGLHRFSSWLSCFCPGGAVPEGRSRRDDRVARDFRPWNALKERCVPEGRWERAGGTPWIATSPAAAAFSSRPYGTKLIFTPDPALKCRATLNLPSGTAPPGQEQLNHPENGCKAHAPLRVPGCLEGRASPRASPEPVRPPVPPRRHACRPPLGCCSLSNP